MFLNLRTSKTKPARPTGLNCNNQKKYAFKDDDDDDDKDDKHDDNDDDKDD